MQGILSPGRGMIRVSDARLPQQVALIASNQANYVAPLAQTSFILPFTYTAPPQAYIRVHSGSDALWIRKPGLEFIQTPSGISTHS